MKFNYTALLHSTKRYLSSFSILFFTLFIFSTGCKESGQKCTPQERDSLLSFVDSIVANLDIPNDLNVEAFAGPHLTPSPACLSVSPEGDLFVGVDMIGSLGREPGKGMIMKLTDCNNDGIYDRHSVFASVNNPRGIFAMGDQVYVLHTAFTGEGKAKEMELVVYEDKDGDGVADDAPKTLVSHMSNTYYLAKRGTDHATNGIRMGIDGWIYIAVGDYGFHEAVGADGTELTMLGGGIVRVRPDGSEMEVYVHGTRNIFDVAIDPKMNIFTRDNTNDGDDWNIRVSHDIQTGEYGYPTLFRHFTEEIIPTMEDLGGGSGTGVLYLQEPSWPKKYQNVLMTADWGRSWLYLNHLTPAGPSFTQEQEDFIEVPQITDVDVDGSGRMYLSAWDGAGYSGDSSKGFILRATPKKWNYTPFQPTKKRSKKELRQLLSSNSAVARLAAQQELLRRSDRGAQKIGWEVASDSSLSTDARIAGMYTFTQAAKEKGIDQLIQLGQQDGMQEYALRALTDRLEWIDQVPIDPFLTSLKSDDPRIQAAAIIGLNRLNRPEAIPELLQTPVPSSFVAVKNGEVGDHKHPNPEIILPHLAVRALVHLNAVKECVEAIGGPHSILALWALRYMHDEEAVEGLIQAYSTAEDQDLKEQIVLTLARIYHEEAPYDGSWWWHTRPDTHGPYYKSIEWESSSRINQFLHLLKDEGDFNSTFFANLNSKYRLGIPDFGGEEEISLGEKINAPDFEKLKAQKGQIGKSSIEDVMLAVAKIKGNAEEGKKLFIQQGCMVCHTISKNEPLKGPFMGQIGSIMNKEQIAEAILKPNASISQGFATVQIQTKDGKSYSGFVSSELADQIVLRDITGNATLIKKDNIEHREELKTSIMPEGLANALSYEEFASLVTFLSEQK